MGNTLRKEETPGTKPQATQVYPVFPCGLCGKRFWFEAGNAQSEGEMTVSNWHVCKVRDSIQ